MSYDTIEAPAARATPSRQPPAGFQLNIGVTEFDIAALLGMSVEFMRKDRSGKRLIPFYRIGTSIRYNPARVFESLASLEEGGHAPRTRAKKSATSLSAG